MRLGAQKAAAVTRPQTRMSTQAKPLKAPEIVDYNKAGIHSAVGEGLVLI